MGAPSAVGALEEGFRTPPQSARPLVWWHWMDGNVSEEGIRADLEWMHRIGIGGVQTFDAGFTTPQRVRQRLTYMTPEWQRAFHLAVSTASRLGLELSIAGSPGWSESGGPWVKPEQAMKKLVWSELRLKGGQRFNGPLPRPSSTIGPFQNIPIRYDHTLNGYGPKNPPHEVYGDVAVLAYRVPEAERSMAELRPEVTSSVGPVDASQLWDTDLESAVVVPFASKDQAAWLQIAFKAPQTIHSLSARVAGSPTVELQSSADARAFTKIIDITPLSMRQTLTFKPVRARYFRLRFVTPPPIFLGALEGFMKVAQPTEHRVMDLTLHTAPRVHLAESKAAFVVAQSLEGSETPEAAPALTLRQNEIRDLTSLVKPDGTLDWTPPAGRWMVLRLGYSLLGVVNHPASAEATGLEVDKLNRAHVQANYRHYLDTFAEVLGPELMGAKGLRGMVNDSWEAGAQNWTEELPAEFARRRGYSLISWLPALTGRVIDSAENTDRFLWDFRQTLGELLAESHYRMIAEELHRRGMIHYAESHESFRAFIGDGMSTKRFADIPMSAMWTGGDWQPQHGDADVRESASVAHLYGQNLVAAEIFTASDHPHGYVPSMLKPVADRALSHGLNRFVIHTSVHQPVNEPGPGVSLGPFGQWFTRQETWAEQARAWIEYLSRSAFLLQQGRAVNDVLYFYGEDSNIAALYGRFGKAALPAVPEGFRYDFANDEALGLLSVQEHRLVTPSGMRYAVLVLDPRTRLMSLPVLKRLRELVKAGATVIGRKPQMTPSLSDDVAAFHAIADELWGKSESCAPRTIGEGRILAHSKTDEAVGELGLEPDFSYKKPAPDSEVWFVHRRLSDGDVYFVNNRRARAETIEASFRVSGKAPEFWYADTGRIAPASYRIEAERTIVPLTLEPMDAVFVVFRELTAQPSRMIPEPTRQILATVDGSWEVRFPAGQGAPSSVRFDSLRSWSEHAEPSIRYFSGTASYRRQIRIPSTAKEGSRIEIDLGTVKDLAEVLVNGQSLGVLWKPPFRVDVTSALRAGTNDLEIRVTNTWVNRLIGDKQPGAKPYAYAAFDPYTAESPLRRSGLLGPVMISSLREP